MDEDLKRVVSLLKSDQLKNRRVAAVILGTQDLKFFRIFTQHYAERAERILRCESNGLIFTHSFDFGDKILSIETDIDDEQNVLIFVKLNDIVFLTYIKRKNEFKLQSRKPDYDDYISNIYDY